MNLQQRRDLLIQLGAYLLRNGESWQEARQKAYDENKWFIPEFVELSATKIAENFFTA